MALGTKVGLIPGDSVLDGDPALPPHKEGGARSPIFDPLLLRPNGWMHQDATWCGGRPHPTDPRRLCVRWGPSPLPKGAEPHPIFNPRLLFPNGCMDQDANWYGGIPG